MKTLKSLRLVLGVAAVTAVSAGNSRARADELVQKDGKVIEWRVLKDGGDTLELQTVDNRTITVAKKDVKEIRTTIPRAPLTGATFNGDLTKGGTPLPLLGLIDPKKHCAGGECRLQAGAVVVSGTGVLEIPHIPVGAYDLEITIERKGGDDECHIGLVGQGKPFSVQIDWNTGQCSGLSGVDGKRVYENETRVNGKQLVIKKPRTIVCAVRTDLVVVLMDGKEFIRWSGAMTRLGLPTRPDKEQNLFFSFNASSFAIQKLVVSPRKD